MTTHNSFPILIVEDDPSSRTLLEKTLTAAGYEVVSVKNGLEAMEIFERKFFPIVITDWVMPEMDGLELCRAIRNREYKWNVFIIILTGRDSKDEVVTGLKAGADDYLTKPFHPAELMARLSIVERYLGLEKELRDANEQIGIMAITDPLTGAYNRGYLTERLPKEIHRAKRYGHDLALIMCDIDYFKKINDSYGHRIGDRVLKEFVDSLKGDIRDSIDWMVRYGGEEFLVVLPETDLKGACLVGERLRRVVSERIFNVGSNKIHITASFGVSAFSPDRHCEKVSAASMIEEADTCLYQAKKDGRNRVRGVSNEKNTCSG